MSRRVVVVGGGVIGTLAAYYLERGGWDVTQIDRAAHGAACSHGNCGLIAASHVLPLAEPGVVGKTFPTLFRPDSPVRVQPRIDPSLWWWLWRFVRRCNRSDMLAAGAARARLLASSTELYEQLNSQEQLPCEWHKQGCLFVYQTAREMERFGETVELVEREFGLPATRYEGPALCELEPALRPDLAGAWHYEMDAHLRPDRLMRHLRERLIQRGVKVLEFCELQGFDTESGRARAARTSRGPLQADAFVVATGAWTPQLGRMLGAAIPIQPGKGYSITMPRPARCPRIPMLLQQHKVAVTPMDSGYRLGSTMEFAGYDTRFRQTRLEYLQRAAAEYLVEPCAESVDEVWYGWRPMTYDGIPIVDFSPALANVLIAAGHGMLGLSMAPATGKLVSELLTGTAPHLDAAPYRLRR